VAVETIQVRPLPPARPLPPVRSQAAPTVDNATVVGRTDHGPSIARFTIHADAEPQPVLPGQYLALGLAVFGRLLPGPYSTATRAGRHADLEFLIRLVPDGALTPRLFELRAGDRLHLGRPKGLFTLRPNDRRTHLFVATGTGLAPFVAMTETLLGEARPPRIVVVHGVAYAEELAFRDRFERWAGDHGVGYVPAISRPDASANAGWRDRTGRVDAILDEVWSTHALKTGASIAYLCGNPGMIATATRVLIDLGLRDDAIRSEHYWPA
jgi:ferredoxin--NADP+ reductase